MDNIEFEALLKKHAGIIQNTLTAFFEKFDVHPSEHDNYRTTAISDIWLYGVGDKSVDEVNSSFVRKSVRWSCIRTRYREAPVLGDGSEEGPEIEQFCEEMGFSEENGCNNRLDGFYVIDGVSFPNMEELADLDQNDLAVINEFLGTPVEDRSRRQTLRRRVDLILLKLGIDSSEIHEYTSRIRRPRRDSRTE
jgi:hypothetical protein